MRRSFTGLVAIFALLVAGSAAACFRPPEGMYLGHDDAINDAEWIALVQPERLLNTPAGTRYRFRVLEYLKGEGPDELTLPDVNDPRARGRAWSSRRVYWDDEPTPVEANFFGHRASSFWLRGGRYFNRTDCRIHPSFLFQGRKYLIFGPHQYALGYENVTDADDLWLGYVREFLDTTKEARWPFPVTPAEYFKAAQAVVRISAWWEDGQVLWELQVLKGEERAYTHMLFVSPLAAFSSALDPNCPQSFDNFPSPRVERLEFLAVFEFVPTQTIGKGQSISCTGGEKNGSGSISGRGLFSLFGAQSFAIEDGVVRFKGDGDVIDPFSLSPITADSLPLETIRMLLEQDL